MFRQLADLDKVPAHSFTIKSEDGTMSENWFQIDGSWRRREGVIIPERRKSGVD